MRIESRPVQMPAREKEVRGARTRLRRSTRQRWYGAVCLFLWRDLTQHGARLPRPFRSTTSLAAPRNMLYRTLVLGSALATTNALQIDSLPVRNDIVSRRQSFGAIAAFGLAVPAAFADDEYISPARAKILAAKEAELAKKGPSKVQAVADSSAQGRSGKAQ